MARSLGRKKLSPPIKVRFRQRRIEFSDRDDPPPDQAGTRLRGLRKRKHLAVVAERKRSARPGPVEKCSSSANIVQSARQRKGDQFGAWHCPQRGGP